MHRNAKFTKINSYNQVNSVLILCFRASVRQEYTNAITDKYV